MITMLAGWIHKSGRLPVLCICCQGYCQWEQQLQGEESGFPRHSCASSGILPPLVF